MQPGVAVMGSIGRHNTKYDTIKPAVLCYQMQPRLAVWRSLNMGNIYTTYDEPNQHRLLLWKNTGNGGKHCAAATCVIANMRQFKKLKLAEKAINR